MNKIYKSIWNHVTRTFTAVSEITVTRKKRALSKSIVLAGMIASMGVQTAFAFDGDEEGDWVAGTHDGTTIYLYNNDNRPGTYDFLHPWVIGGENAARDYTDLTASRPGLIFNKYRLHVTEEGATLNLDDWEGSLIDQSNHGLSQIVVKADDWHGGNTDAHHFVVVNDSRDASEDTYVQVLRQTDVNGQASNIGTATYVMGGAAVNKLGTTVDGKPHSEETGIHDNDGDGSYSEGLYVAMLLRAVNITQDKVLTLNITGDDDNIWAAQVHGQGGITYSGESSESTKVILQDKYNFGTNDYYGPTNIGSITLDLNRTNAFGQASFITASDAVINVNQSDAWTSAGELHLTDSTVNFTAAQSGFTVTNDNSEETTNTATFSGANTISGGANSFTYLIRGDAQVVDGTTTFAGTNIKTQVAGSLTLHSVGGIANDTAIEIGGALNFVGAGATPTKQTLTQTFAAYDDTDDKYTVNLSKGSNIKYASGSILSGVLTTSLSDVSKLETDNQSNLGNLVMFNRQSDKARSQLTLKLASGAENLTLTTNLSGDGLTILDAGQDDGTNAQISLDSGVDLSNYSGWIRLQNGTMSLTSVAANILKTDNGIQTGLSLGSGSTLVITSAQTIENFGWSTASAGGVLDLSKFTFEDVNSAALYVNSIQVGASNVIRVDINKMAVDANVQEGYILDLDNSNPTQLLVSGTLSDSESAGRGSQDFVLVGLEEAEDSPGTGDDKHYKYDQTLFSSNSGETIKQNAAIATWDVDADYYSAGENGVKEDGVYLNYSIKSLTLLNGTEVPDEDDPVIDETQPLHWNAALVAKAGNNNRLTANVHGYGILQVNNDSGTVVYLDGNKSDYKGATVVTGSTTLDSTFGALGQSVLVLTDTSNYVLRQGPDDTVVQQLNGVITDSGSHTINVNGNTIEIVANGLSEASAANLASGYQTDITSGNVLGAQTVLSGDGIFSIGSDGNQETGISLTAKSANVFNTYSGTVQLAGHSSSLTIEGDVALTRGIFTGGTDAKIFLNTSSQIGENEGIAGADFTGFVGTLSLAQKTYDVYNLGKLNSSAKLVLNSSTVNFHGIEGGFANAVTGTGGSWNLDDSNITLTEDSKTKEGFDKVNVNGSSMLTLVASEKRTDGGLGLFGKSTDDSNKYDVAFSGKGTLNLSGYTLNSNQLNFGTGDTETFNGTLGLLGSTQYTLLSSADYGVALNSGTLTVEGQDLTAAALSFTGTNNVLDLTNAVALSEGAALFTVNGNIESSDATNDKLTVKISKEQRNEEIANKNILDQDDGGWDQRLVNAKDGVKINDENVEIQVDGNALDGFTQNLGTATGHYDAKGVVNGGDIGASYELTQIDFATGSEVNLDSANAQDQLKTLNVLLNSNEDGAGTINIANEVTLSNAQGSSFSGTYKLSETATLTLNGFENAATVSLEDNSTLVVGSNQTLTITDASSGSGTVEFANSADGLTLTLTGNSNLASGSKFVSLSQHKSDRIALSQDASLALDGANAALSDYNGKIALGANSTLQLSESGSNAVNLDLVTNGPTTATVDLVSGTYKITSIENYSGAWNVREGSTLNLNGIGSKDDLVNFNNVLNPQGDASQEGNAGGVIALSGGSGIVVGENAGGFNGTWDLATSTSAEKLSVNGKLGATEVTLGKSDELEYSTTETGVQTILTDVNSGGTVAGTFKVSGGKYSIDADTTVRVAETDVISGASLKASLDQLGSTIVITGENSTVRVQDEANEADNKFSFDGKQVSGDGVLHVDLGNPSSILDFADNAGAEGNSIKVRLTNAAYSYDANDNFSSYVVGGNGRFVVGTDAVNLGANGTIGWEYLREDSANKGIIDLSGFDLNVSDAPAIDAGHIILSDNNYVQINTQNLTSSGVVASGGILSLDDDENPDRLLISGERVGDTGSTNVVLLDENGNRYAPSGTATSYLNSYEGGDRAAKLDWGVGAKYYEQGEDEVTGSGIYLNYGVQTITLLNGSKKDTADTTSALSLRAVLHAQASADNSVADNTLTSTVTGHGILQVENTAYQNDGDNTNTEQVVVSLEGNGSNYTGATIVGGYTTLEATQAALGSSTLVLAQENSNFNLKASQEDEDNSVQAIFTDDGSHNLLINGQLTIEGNLLSEKDLAVLASGYGITYDQNDLTANVIGANTSLTGSGTLTLNSNLTAKSAGAFNSFEGTVAIGQEQTLTIVSATDASNAKISLHGGKFTGGDAAIIALNTSAQIGADANSNEGIAGADFTGFVGTLSLAQKTYDVYNLGKLNSSAKLVLNSSTVNFHGIEGGFANAVTGTGGSWNLDDSNITLTEDSKTKEGFDKVDIDSNSTLTLKTGGLEKFGQTDGDYNVAFSGEGTLNLSGYTLSSDQLDFTYQNGEGGTETFTGTLGLLNSKYTLSGGATYSVDLDGDATLTAEGTEVSVQSFTFDDGATLDLTQVNNTGNSNPLFTANSYSGSGILNVTITDDQLKEVPAHLETNILDQDDETGANWFVAAGDASGITEENVSIQVSGESGETGLSGSAEVTLQQGVTGTYELGTAISSGGIGVNYRLTELDVAQNAVGFALDAGDQTDADLAVKLTGTGSIGIGGTIEVAYQEGSEFAGKYAPDTGAHLILSGENSGVAEVDFGAESNTVADLTLNSDQKLILGTVGSGSIVTLKDSEDNQVKLTVQGENVFADGSTLLGSGNTNLVLNDSAQLEVENVSTTFTDFDGGIGLGSESHLTLNGVAEGTSYSLDNINSSAADSTVTLVSGSYSLSGSAYTGEWELGNSATLNLGGNVSFTANGAKLSSAEGVEDTTKPVVNVGENLTVTADADNLAGFTNGTFTLGNESTLHINANGQEAFLSSGVNVSGLNGENRQGTLELAGSGTFNSNVTANTFSVASGNVTLGGSSINVTNTVVGVDGDADNEASLTAAKGQIGSSSLTIYEGGVLNVTVGEKTGSFVQQISGEGTLHIDLGGKDLSFTADTQNQGSQTTIIVANGTHTYDANDGFSNYGVDAKGTLKVSESNTDLANFTWQSSLVDDKVVGGTLDLSEIQYNGGPAMTVDNITVGDAGSIKLDLDSWVEGIENAPSTDTNLLDADNGNKESSVLVIKGEVTGDASNLVLDANQSGNTTTSYPNDAGESLATVRWGYVLTNNLNSESDNKGIALSYGVTELKLANAGKADEVVLSPDERPDADDTFSALISGSGKLSIQGNVTLSHSGNTFTDSTITVTSDNKLTTQGSNVLGSGSNTLKLDNASYEMAASTGHDAYSETVTLETNGKSSVTLNGNRLNLANGSTISAETTFGGDAANNGGSALTALGEVTLEGASQTLGNLGVAGLKLAIDAIGNVTAAGGSIEKLENISGEGKFTLTLNPNQQATAGDLTDFTGTVVAGSGQTFVLNDGSKTETVKVDLSNGGTLTSSTESTISTIAGLITTADSVIDLGKMTVVGEKASGMLTVIDGDSTLAAGTELKVKVETDITSESVLSLDDGKFTKLVTGLGEDQRADFTIAQAGDETITGKLTNAGGKEIGTAHYTFTKDVMADSDGMAAGLTSTLTKIDLTDELVLSNSADTSADLNAEVQGTNESAVTVSFGEIELVKDNSYGQLKVNEGATANLTGVQTITGTGGVVSGQIVADAGKLKLASGAGLTFKDVQTGLADVSLNNNATLTLSGLDPTDNSSLLGATKLNVVDGTSNLQIVASTGLLDDDNLVFPASPDYKATALDIAVQNSEVTLSDNWVDITGNLSMDVTGGSSVTMAGKTSDALSVDWSNLTVDQDSNVTLNGNGAALTFTGLNEGKLAGTVNINNFEFAFGANTADVSVNNQLLESAGHVNFTNSDLVADGASTVGNLTLSGESTLAFEESKQIAMGEASSSLITVSEGKTLNLGGATIKIDTDDLSFDFKDTESGTTSAPLLNALNDAQQENVKYFQLVEGNVSGLGELTDMNGNALVDTSAVTVIGEDGKTVAELGFGANLQQGEGAKDLWVGQGLQKLSLFKSVELNAGDGKGLTLDGNGVFTINAVIEASDKEGADDVIDLTIAGGTPIRLAGANGNITGTTTVAEDGKLVLANNNTLGSQTDLDVQGTLEIETGFTQSAETLNVSGTGTLDLAEGAKLDVTTAPEESASAIIGGTVTGSGTLTFAENAQVHIAETAKLNGVTWDLTKGAAMVIAAGTNGQSITSGTISGGTVLKNGTGDLTLGYGIVNNNGVAVDVQEGNLKIDGWTNTLTLKSLNLHKSEFTMFGNLATADGLSADGARITLGASDTDFKDYTIDGLYSGSATFVFDTALGETSDGDSLTFAGDVAEGSHALVEVNNHTTLRPSMSVADLTLISVNGEVAEDFATLQGGNLSKDGFDWGLVAKEGENGYTDFYLSAEAGSDPSDPSKPIYKMDARVGALAGFAASVDLFEMTIHDRQGTRAWINPITGEKTTTSLWMRQTMSKSDSSDSSGQFGGRSDDRATTIGGDILQLSPSGSGLVYAGLMAGFGSSDYDANSSVTSASAKADTDAWMVGAYAGWNQNDPKNDRTGAYLAGWVQYAHFSSDIVRSGEKKLDAKASGLSASLEAGWIVKAAEFQMQGGATEGAFYIEPHAQVTWWGTDYDNIDGENIEFEGQHNITTRLGARLTMETSGATNFSPYLEANWVHNTKEYGVQWGEAESYIEGTQNQAELKFGAETFFTDSFSGYAQIRANWGGDGYNRQEGSLGLKYRF